ncbi:MAG: hypothetical protein DRO88_07980 [Promethearchaeia archaeon]|nr:MAG: hypothetical protein DRO88_07980 [Candidatus Lokiarchaeia archaeon]
MLLEPKLVKQMVKETEEMRKKIQNSGENLLESEYIYTSKVKARQVEKMQIEISTANHKVIVDEPKPFGKDEGASPIDLLLAAYAGCFQITLIFLSCASNLDVEDIKVEISAQMDARDGFRGPKSPPPRIKSMKILTIFKTSEPEKKIQRIIRKAKHDCSVGGSLHPDIKKEYILEIVPMSQNSEKEE